MGDETTLKPKPKKKPDNFFNLESLTPNGNGNNNPTTQHSQQTEQPKTDNFFSLDALKKKDGGSESTNTSQPTLSNSEVPLPSQNGNVPHGTSGNNYPTSNIFQPPSATIVTNDGASFNLPNLSLTPDAVRGLQQRVTSKTATPQDIQLISQATGKPQTAVAAYVNQNKNIGSAVEATDKINANNQALIAGVLHLNNMLGLKFNPVDILSSADKTATFLNGLKNLTAFEIQRRKENAQAQFTSSRTGGAGLEEPTNIAPLDENILKQLNDYTEQLKNHVVNKTVEEDLQNNVPKEQTISKIFQRIDPNGYSQNKKASLSNLPNPLGSHIQDLGNVYDYLSGNNQEKDDLLNSQKGIAEQQYNNSLRDLGIQKKSQGILNNNPALVKQGDDILSKVDYNVNDKYPQLVKQEMVRRVNEAIANESGVLQGSDGQNLRERIIGASPLDYARQLKQMGYLDNPKTKDLAIDLINHPSAFADNSIIGSMGDSFFQPFKDLGMSVGDITGFRNAKDITTDKIKENLFPKDFSGNAEDNPVQLKGYVKGLRTMLNTTANLAGMVTISAATEGLGTGAGLSAGAARSLGAYTSFGLPSFDGALKDAPNIGIDNTAAQYLYATINSIANAEGGRLLDLGKITRIPGVAEDFAKIANNISDESIVKQALADGKDKYIDFAMKYGKNVTKGAATMAYFNIANNITKMAFGDPNTNAEDILPKAGTAFMDGVLGMSIMGAFGATADMKNEKNTSFKGTIYNWALNHDAAKDVLDIGLKNGTYTKPEYDSKVQILNTARVAKNTIDANEQDTGIPLTPDQKAVYVANKTAQSVFVKKSEQPGIPEETKNKYLAQADRLGEQSVQVLDGLKFTPTLEPLYNLFDAEKKLNEAQSNFNPADKKSEDELLAAKDNYEKLYTDYLNGNSDKPISVEKKKEEPKVANFPSEEEFKSKGEIVVSTMDAENRLSNGERIFAAHDMDSVPDTEIIHAKDLERYTPDQLIAIPPEEPSGISSNGEGDVKNNFPEEQSNTRTDVTKKLLDHLADVTGNEKYKGDINSGDYVTWLNDIPQQEIADKVKNLLNQPRKAFDEIQKYQKENTQPLTKTELPKEETPNTTENISSPPKTNNNEKSDSEKSVQANVQNENGGQQAGQDVGQKNDVQKEVLNQEGAGKKTSAPLDTSNKSIFDALDKAENKRSGAGIEKAKNKVEESLGDKGKQARYIHDNFDNILKQLNLKVEC